VARTTFPPLEGDFTRALLRSAESDEPSSAAYAKAATALGVGAGLGIGASLAAPSAVAVGIARWSGSTALRLWALGVSGALLVGGGALLLHAHPPAGASLAVENSAARRFVPTPPAARLPAAPLLQASPAAPRVLPGLPQPTTELDADELAAEAATRGAAVGLTSAEGATASGNALAPVAAVPAAAALRAAGGNGVRRVARPTSGSSGSSGSSLAEQVQSLDRARVALGSGDPSKALAEIGHYRQAWPQGVFLTEASVLEIEALASRGERSLAVSRAAAFVAAHPDSPQAERLRRLIPEGGLYERGRRVAPAPAPCPLPPP
jgi:hypothetical protein